MPPPSLENMVRWRSKPELFVTDLFRDPKTGAPVTLAPWHTEALHAVSAHDRVSIRAARGVGKTAMLAWLCLMRLSCYKDAFNVFTAPRREQMSMAAWREIKKWLACMDSHMRDNFEVQASRIYMPGLRNEAVATTVGAGSYEGLQGIHDGNLMFFVDEANGVPDNVLAPREAWSNVNEYDARARDLVERFQRNFEPFAEQVTEDVRAAAIRSLEPID